MANKTFRKNLMRAIAAGSVFFGVYLLLTAGIARNVGIDRAVSFVAEGMRTGLENPAAQLVFSEKNPGNQLALDNSKSVQNQNQTKNAEEPTATSRQDQRALFDVLTQPLFGESNKGSILILSGVAGVSVFVALYLARRVYRRKKMMRIKNGNGKK